LDDSIIRAVWMTHQELKASQAIHRSPQVLKCVEDYLAGQQFPLSVITHFN
ncbi:MAG: NUDIX hydrolase, partial [Methylophilaceae bacterium]|nr:NUDIX hydrolase [Methylophilaceae bacterium]